MDTHSLIVNPYAHITSYADENAQIIGLEIDLPVPDEGKKVFQIFSESNADLVDFLLDLTKWGFSHFNADDLTADERQFLLKNGFLVNKDTAPEKPLFACFLDEIEFENNSDTPDIENLIVNPSFRFEPFNLTDASRLIHVNNFSPHFSTVWIKLPVTEIEIGYWLRNEYIEIVQKLTAGEKIPFEINKKVLLKLVHAEILIDPDSIQEKKAKIEKSLQASAETFRREKYVVIEKLLPYFYLMPLKGFFRQYVSHGFMPFNDTQVKRRYYQHNLPLAQFFHQTFAKIMSKIVGEEVQPSYVYAASYIEDAKLDPHIDREQCEYSISLQIDYQPEPENDVSPWALYVAPLTGNEIKIISDDNETLSWENYPEDNSTNKDYRKFHLKSGDGLIYKGRELVHYRYPLAKNHKSTSLFFHYVSKNYAGRLT